MTGPAPTGPLRIGTRGSPLALAQANETRDRLRAAHPHLREPGAVEVVAIRTTGDVILDRTLMEAGGKGLFTKELEEALADGRIDLAVHSMKDVPTWLPDGMEICCLLPREDPRDAFLSPRVRRLEELPPGARVGTASLRRQAQVLALRPDLTVVPFRGNVQTRLRKLEAGEVDATLLALAGLRRVGLADCADSVIEPDRMLPAVAQGAIGVEIRKADEMVRALLAPLHCPETALRVTAERALLKVLDGSCRTPIAALAVLRPDGSLHLDALCASPDGRRVLRASRTGPVSDAVPMGTDAGEELKARMPPDFFAT